MPVSGLADLRAASTPFPGRGPLPELLDASPGQ